MYKTDKNEESKEKDGKEKEGDVQRQKEPYREIN